MAELTQTEIETKLSDIDSKIETIRTALAGGTGAAQYTDYSVGSLSVSGSQQLDALLKLREHYQGLLDKVPKEIARHSDYDVAVTGKDDTELLGDE